VINIIKEEMNKKYIKKEAGEDRLQANYMQYGKGNDILRFIINNSGIDINDVQNSMESEETA